jgi:hypothetical protein
MPQFEILLDGVPVGFASSMKFPKMWPDIDPNQPGTYNLSADCTLKVKPNNDLKCSYTQTCSPKENELINAWLEGVKRPTNSMTMSVESEFKGNDLMFEFLKTWSDHIKEGAAKQTLVPGEMFVVSPGYSVSAPRTPEPRLEIPFRLKWHRYGVSVIGADGIEFTQDYFDGPFRCGRVARRWAKHKVKVQDKKIVGQLGTLRGMTFHTGGPRMDDTILNQCANPSNSISQLELLGQLEEFCKLNPNLEWKFPVIDFVEERTPEMEQARKYEILFGASILKEPARTIKINPGT